MTDLAVTLAAMAPEDRLAALRELPPDDLLALRYHWPLFARPDQLPPDEPFRTWLMNGGRGAGKTRSAAEWIRSEIESGRRRSIGIIGPTSDTLRRDVVQGESGLLSIAPPWFTPMHEPSQRRVVYPNGATCYLLSSQESNRIRGVNLDGFWGDELTSWDDAEACWDNLQFALRISGPLGHSPAGVVSTTPKRHELLKKIIADPSTVITRSKTFDNAANLDPKTLEYLRGKYAGTTLGRQELDAEILNDVEGALWTRALIEGNRIGDAALERKELRRVVVAVDPAGGSSSNSDETGIIVAGVGYDRHFYVLADRSGKYTPKGWGRAALAAFEQFKADRIIAEKNFGGEMVESNIRSCATRPHLVPIRMVHASRGKAVRAEPIVSLYEQGLVHHVGTFPGLEDQLTGWDPAEGGKSPDRLDANVWALTELSTTGGGAWLHRSIT